jgi:CheY-like chemotaxis protein
MLVAAGQIETDTFGSVIQPGGYICLEVTDNGCGMDEETQKRIFEPFYTTKVTGRGLGMSAIHGIVKAHEGILRLTSSPGVGTSFKIYFPVPVASDTDTTEVPTTVAAVDAGGTILLVEDEELLRTMGEELLVALGFTAMTAANGREALQIYRELTGEIDAILLDLIMPVMGGIETYHQLRTISSTIPIIICSGYGVESVEDVIVQHQYTGFLHKPYKPRELRDTIARMITGDDRNML